MHRIAYRRIYRCGGGGEGEGEEEGEGERGGGGGGGKGDLRLTSTGTRNFGYNFYQHFSKAIIYATCIFPSKQCVKVIIKS